MSVRDFYDELASDYHLVYPDWDASIQRQGEALDRLIRDRHPQAIDVLDCSCGIGTQALGLALRGYRVHGTDISEKSLERARNEAARIGAEVSFSVCDFRDLSPVAGSFDVVISCDNAIPHLLSDADLSKAFKSMRSKLRAGGLMVISVRDYDQALIDRPATALPLITQGPPRQILVRLHDWDAPDSPMYTVNLLVLTEGHEGWSIAHHSARYRALRRQTITGAVQDSGFTEVTWYTPDQVGFYQPVMTAVNGSR